MKYRDMMKRNNENFGWCKPLSWEGGKVIIAINEGTVSGIRVDGADVPTTPENIKSVAQRLNDCYGDYAGWSDAHIILDCADDAEELPCRCCPWFRVCDAMDELAD